MYWFALHGKDEFINKKMHQGGGKLEKPCWYMELNKLRCSCLHPRNRSKVPKGPKDINSKLA